MPLPGIFLRGLWPRRVLVSPIADPRCVTKDETGAKWLCPDTSRNFTAVAIFGTMPLDVDLWLCWAGSRCRGEAACFPVLMDGLTRTPAIGTAPLRKAGQACPARRPTRGILNCGRSLQEKCPRPDSNRHGPFGPADFKSAAYTNFATGAVAEMRKVRWPTGSMLAGLYTFDPVSS